MRFGVKTDKGLIREKNEDFFNVIFGETDVPNCFIVADGMGGHKSGEVASALAVEVVSKSFLKQKGYFGEEQNVVKIITDVMKEANSKVLQKSKEEVLNKGMGTTLIMAVVSKEKLCIGHVGDSRAYLFRNKKLERITTDHSYIEELIKNGTLTKKEARNHPKKNVITRALGSEEEVDIDIYSRDIKQGDVFMVCTDGLTNMLTDKEIVNILIEFDDPQEACDKFIYMANEKGGRDNTTVVVFKR